MGTQQLTGAMQADMKAVGPFPAVSLAEAPAAIKEAGLILPVEIGLFTFNGEGTKISSMTWDGELGEAPHTLSSRRLAAAYPREEELTHYDCAHDAALYPTRRTGETSGSNTMDKTPPVGMPVLFGAMGKVL